MTAMEQKALDEIYDRAIDLQFAVQQFHQFDPNVMVMEVHELSEMLCKVQSGKFKTDIGDQVNRVYEDADAD